MTVRANPPPAPLKALGREVVLYLQGIANRRTAPVADLSQTISASPTQAEVQAISDKIDEFFAALRAAGLMEE